MSNYNDSWRKDRVKDENLVLSVLKAMDILECFLHGEPELGVMEMNRRLKLSPSTIHRLIKTMEAGGFLKQDPVTQKYSPGIKLSLLGIFALENFQLKSFALPFMQEIADYCGETVNLGILDDGQMVYVNNIESQKAVRTYISPGQRAFVHSTAIGKVLLCEMDKQEILAILEKHGMKKLTANTITETDAFFAELEKVRNQRYAMDAEEDEEDSMCIACPIRDRNGTIIAGISVTGPVNRINSRKDNLLGKLQEVTEKLSVALGCLKETLVH